MSAPRKSTLRKSRNKFFDRERMPRDQSFWLYYLTQHAPDVRLAPEDLDVLRAWKPERSNCPELSGVVEDLLTSMPAEWRPVADDVFVGRTIGADVNAAARTKHDARLVTLSLQYTNVLHAYVVVFDEQQAAMRAVLTASDDGGPSADAAIDLIGSDRFDRYWDLLEQGRPNWMDPRLVAGLVADLQVLPGHERSPAREHVVLAAETWIVCHELAHHLLGHTVSKRRTLPASALVDGHRPAGLWTGLNASQREELDADVLAFLLAAGACAGDLPLARGLYAAEMGAGTALVALAHVKDAWTTVRAPEETHPGFDLRWAAVRALTQDLSRDMERGPVGDHPRDLLLDLSVFAEAAAAAAQARRADALHDRPRLRDLVGASLRAKQELWTEIGPPPG